MNQLQQIAKGTYNNLTNKKEDLYKSRLKVCKKCKLYIKDKIFGDLCNKKLYLNPETDETSLDRKEGFIRGCGCIIKSKARLEEANCVCGKW